jgi:hypothetical protein
MQGYMRGRYVPVESRQLATQFVDVPNNLTWQELLASEAFMALKTPRERGEMIERSLSLEERLKLAALSKPSED